MYIYIDNKFDQIDLALDHAAASALNTALESAYKGKHFVFGSKAVLKYCSSNTSLSVTAKAYAKYVLNRFSDLASTASFIVTKVNLTPDKIGVVKTHDSEWLIGSDVAAQSSFSSTILLSEDDDDTVVISEAAKHYRCVNKIKMPIEFRFSSRGGGGSSTSDHLQTISDEMDSFCICITDSDKGSPFGSSKETSRKCASVASKTPWVVSHYQLDVRELENLIPLAWYEECAPVQSQERVAQVLLLRKQFGDQYLRFADLKDGITFEKLKLLPNGGPDKTFWVNYLKSLHESGVNCCSCGASVFGGDFDEIGCSCYAYPPIGLNSLAWVMDFFKHKGHPHEALRLATNDCRLPEWLGVGGRAFEWGISVSKSRG